MLEWLTDENVPRRIVSMLSDRGYDTADIRERGLDGAEDSLVFDVAQREGRVVVTTDRDFSSIILYPPETHWGIVVLRMSKPRGAGFVSLFESFLDSIDLNSLSHAITVVSETRVRQRRRLTS